MMGKQRLRAIVTKMTKFCRDARSPRPRSLTPSASQHPVADHQRLTDEHNTRKIGAAPYLAVILAVCSCANFTASFGLQERKRCHGVSRRAANLKSVAPPVPDIVAPVLVCSD